MRTRRPNQMSMFLDRISRKSLRIREKSRLREPGAQTVPALPFSSSMMTRHRIVQCALLTTAITVQPALAFPTPVAQAPAGVVSGIVSLPASDGQPVAVPGVTLTLTSADRQPHVDVSDD